MKKYSAFTLSEVLITVGVIGVVAALTIPTLVSDYQNKAFSAKFKKVVYEFTSNVDMFITEEGAASLKGTSIFTNKLPNGNSVTDGLANFMQNKFKVIMTCNANSSDCFASAYKSLNGSASTNSICSGNSYKLADGSVVCVTKDTDSLSVAVDTNGNDMPNIAGRDLFKFKVDKNAAPAADGESSVCKTKATGEGCYKALIESNWVMSY